MFFNRQKQLVDTRPTLASWPKKIFELRELPQKYHSYVKQWLDEGMELGNITYVPRISAYFTSQPEYAICWHQNLVMLLYEVEGTITQTILQPKDVLSVEYHIQLLNCIVSVTLKDGNSIQTKDFFYNKTMERQFIPIINILLSMPADYCMNVFEKENTAFAQLDCESYSMYNYSKLVYHMDENVHSYFWDKEDIKIRLFSQKKEPPEYLLAETEKGMCLVQTQFYGISASYFLWNSLEKISLLQNPCNIIVSTSYNKNYKIPVTNKAILKATNFVDAIAPILSSFSLKTQ